MSVPKKGRAHRAGTAPTAAQGRRRAFAPYEARPLLGAVGLFRGIAI